LAFANRSLRGASRTRTHRNGTRGFKQEIGCAIDNHFDDDNHHLISSYFQWSNHDDVSSRDVNDVSVAGLGATGSQRTVARLWVCDDDELQPDDNDNDNDIHYNVNHHTDDEWIDEWIDEWNDDHDNE
jgi:hypothetical protein